ncbi:unnamed protein product [Rhodiola kirilowii]
MVVKLDEVLHMGVLEVYVVSLLLAKLPGSSSLMESSDRSYLMTLMNPDHTYIASSVVLGTKVINSKHPRTMMNINLATQFTPWAYSYSVSCHQLDENWK